jgi:hypothetical protein
MNFCWALLHWCSSNLGIVYPWYTYALCKTAMACMVFVANGQIRHYKIEKIIIFKKSFHFCIMKLLIFHSCKLWIFLKFVITLDIHMKKFYICDRLHWILIWKSSTYVTDGGIVCAEATKVLWSKIFFSISFYVMSLASIPRGI